MRNNLSKERILTGKVKPTKRIIKEKIARFVNDDAEDMSIIGSSLSIGVRNVRELIRAVTEGTNEFQELMINECTLIYECRVCRNLFRSVANFMSHKRKYCCQKFCFSNNGFFNDQQQPKNGTHEEPFEVLPEPAPNGTWNNIKPVLSTSNIVTRSPMKILNRLLNGSSPSKRIVVKSPLRHSLESKAIKASSPASLKERHSSRDTEIADTIFIGEMALRNRRQPVNAAVQCRLQKVPQSSVAMRQIVVPDATTGESYYRQEENESNPELKFVDYLLKPDGRLSTVNQTSQVVCHQCEAEFPSKRMLDRHVSVYHKMRKCYPCPLCKTFFVSPFCVYRHLSKLHHKSEEQIRRLRAQVLAKVVNRELYQETKPVSETISESLIEAREEQKWMAQFEGELHCNLCGKSFTRRAALTVHSSKCKLPSPKPVKEPEPLSLACDKCGRDFVRRAVLTVHAQSCNGSAKSVPSHTCCCGRSFLHRRSLVLHLPRCSNSSKLLPDVRLVTPQKVTPKNEHVSPSSIQVRRNYEKSSSLLSPTCVCPLSCNLHPHSIPGKLGAVIRKLHERPSDGERANFRTPTAVTSSCHNFRPTNNVSELTERSPDRIVRCARETHDSEASNKSNCSVLKAIITTFAETSPKDLNNQYTLSSLSTVFEKCKSVAMKKKVSEPIRVQVIDADMVEYPSDSSEKDPAVDERSLNGESDNLNNELDATARSPASVVPISLDSGVVVPSRSNSPQLHTVIPLPYPEFGQLIDDNAVSTTLIAADVLKNGDIDSDVLSVSCGTDTSDDFLSDHNRTLFEDKLIDTPIGEVLSDDEDSGLSEDYGLQTSSNCRPDSPFPGFDAPSIQDSLTLSAVRKIVFDLSKELSTTSACSDSIDYCRNYSTQL